MTEDFITNSIEHDLEEEKPSPIKKVIIISVAVLMISLFLVYAIMGSAQQKILGNLNAKSIFNSSLHFKEYNLFFQNNTNSILSELFTKNQVLKKVEMSVCLSGTNKNKNYYLNSIFYPEIFEQPLTHVNFASCPDNTLIMLHSHPFGDCLASETDLNTLKNAQKRNKNVLMVIMCKENNYALYT